VHFEVDPRWYAFIVVGLVLAIDITRTVVSLRPRGISTARLCSNGTRQRLRRLLAVVVGLIAASRWRPATGRGPFVARSCSARLLG
jgi:hypothetical protein